MWSFRTNGNFIDFVHTDETSLAVENTIVSLHNTSKCVDWSLPEDTTRISFTINEAKYSNILITDIDFDGTQMNSQDDFETGIEAMFPGLAGGSSGYLSYVASISQTGTSAPSDGNSGNGLQNTLGGAVTWSREDDGVLLGLTNIPATDIDKVWIQFINGTPGNIGAIFMPISDYNAITGYMTIYAAVSGDFIGVFIETLDAAFVYTEFSTLIGASKFRLPELKYYNNA